MSRLILTLQVVDTCFEPCFVNSAAICGREFIVFDYCLACVCVCVFPLKDAAGVSVSWYLNDDGGAFIHCDYSIVMGSSEHL